MKNQEKKDSLLEAFKSNLLKIESLAEINGGRNTYSLSGTSGASATTGDYTGQDSDLMDGMHSSRLRPDKPGK